MPDSDTKLVEAMESNSNESLNTETKRRKNRSSNTWKQNIDRFLFTMIWILGILAMSLVFYHVSLLKVYHANFSAAEDDNKIATTERDAIPVATEYKSDIKREFDDTITKTRDLLEKVLNGTCRTKECMIAASRIHNALNLSAEPCNDFYEFACGNSNTRKNPIVIHTALVFMQLEAMIENEFHFEQSKEFGLLKSFYTSCMNQTEIEAVGLRQFNEIIRKIGGWPLVEGEQWNETAFQWIESIRQMRNIGLNTNHLFAMEISTHFKNSSIRSLMISQPESKLYRKFLLNDTEPMYQKYHSSMIELAGIFGVHLNPVTELEITDLLAFERALANISLADEELRDFEAQFNPFKISELEIKYPYIRWMDYFEALLPADMKITPDEVVIVLTPRYFDHLAEVLRNTSNRTISNLFAWRVLLESSKFLHDSVFEHTKQFIDSFNSGTTEKPIRWLHCVTITTKVLSPAVGAVYVRKFINNTAKSDEHAVQLVESIRSSFIEMLNNATWMDENTKKMAVNKVKSTTAHIGFLKELSNKTKLEHYYKSLTLNESEFLLNALRLNKFEMDYDFHQLHEPIENDKWLKYPNPASMGVYPMIRQNEILIPSVMLCGAFLSDKRPNYMNYGAIGQIIGHELGHGFDDLGSQVDKNGNLKDWWLPETKQIFLNKTNCIIEQYGNFTEPITKINVNGKLTQGENIADNVGMKSAYYAYTKWLEHNNDEKYLPGLHQFTPKKMFWISAAQLWCKETDNLNTKASINRDPFTPNRFRIIGSMRNSKEFAMDFRCAPGTPMNPIEKCEIW